MSDVFQRIKNEREEARAGALRAWGMAWSQPMRRRVAIWIATMLCLFAGITVFDRLMSTVTTASYTDMDAAVADRAIDRGWIPEFLPEDAHTIRERHNLDTNEGWGKFSFDNWDDGIRLAHCRSVPTAPMPRSPNGVIGLYYAHWWPGTLDDSLVYFQGVEQSRFWLAIDFDRKVGYFWQGVRSVNS